MKSVIGSRFDFEVVDIFVGMIEKKVRLKKELLQQSIRDHSTEPYNRRQLNWILRLPWQ